MLKKYSIKKISILNVFFYLIAFFSPILFFSASQNTIILVNTITYILGALAMIFLYLKTKNTANLSIELAKTISSPLKTILIGLGGILVAIILQSITSAIEVIITGNSLESQNTQAIMKMLVNNPTLILAIAIGGPIMEEFVFRRSFIALMEPSIGFWFSAIISSAVFSIIHLDGHFFVYFSMGLFFAFLYKKTGRIWTSILSHCGMNALVVIIQLYLS